MMPSIIVYAVWFGWVPSDEYKFHIITLFNSVFLKNLYNWPTY